MSNLPAIFARILFATIVAAASISSAYASTYFVSASASSSGTGTQVAPWPSITAALNSARIRGGDKILLQTGSYGKLLINGFNFSSEVTIAVVPKARVHFEQIEIRASKNITIRGLQVWPSRPRSGNGFLVKTSKNSPNIHFFNLDIRSVKDAGNYRKWSKSAWRSRKINGVLLQGVKNSISGSTVTGVYNAINITGNNSRIFRNVVRGFSADATRASGRNSHVIDNQIRDCVKIDGNHDDGFQTWTKGKDGKVHGGTNSGLVLEGNLIEEWTGAKNHPLRCHLQGIFIGGFQDDLVIRNNVVSVSAFHGITAYGVTRGIIVNNTLVNSIAPSRKQPWIGIWGHKNRGSRQMTIANNVAPVFKINSQPKLNLQQFRNVVLINPAQQLRAPFNGDYRPVAGSLLIDAGNLDLAPATDIDGTPRTLGSSVDIGAYEVQ